MYLLNFYIIKNFITKFTFILVGFILLFFIVDIIGNIDKFIESSLSQKEIFKYSILSIPSFVSIALPMTTLLSCIFTIGQLQKNHELTAIKASGISLKKVSSILIVLGICISGISFIFDNTIVSQTMKEKEIINVKMTNSSHNAKENARPSHIIVENDTKKLLHIENYDFLNNKATGVKIQPLNSIFQEMKKNKFLEYQLEIDSMIYIKNIVKDNNTFRHGWIRKGLTLRESQDYMISRPLPNDTVFFYTEDKSFFTEEDLNSLLPNSKELNYWELKKLSSKRPEEIKLQVDYNFKLAFSFTSIIMILFGIGLSIKNPRTNYTTGIGLGIIVIFLYYLGIKFGQSLGYSKALSPFASVWIINFIFLSSGVWLCSKIRT